MDLHVTIASIDGPMLDACEAYCSLEKISLQKVNGGVECLRDLRRSRPDVLVLDADLPWGGGDGVLQVMCAEPPLAQIPVVLLCDDEDEASINRRWPTNVVGRLIKRVCVDTLFELVLSAADFAGLLRQANSPPDSPRQPLSAEFNDEWTGPNQIGGNIHAPNQLRRS